MNHTTKQQKSFYLAFALTTSIQFHTLHDEYQTTDSKFCLNLCKGKSVLSNTGQQVISKTQTFGIDEMIKETEMYLYLILNHFDTFSEDEYSIKMTEQTQNEVNIIFDEKINLYRYVQDHKMNNKDFWTEISPSVDTKRFSITIKKRVFMKKTRFELDEIINSQEAGQEHDVVVGLDPSPTILKTSKLAIDKRKSRSFQSSFGNFTPIPPRRLDTISEEESNLPLTERKEKEDFNMYASNSSEKYKVKQRFSEGLKSNQEGFESALKRQSTWIERNGNSDVFDEIVNAFQDTGTPYMEDNIKQLRKHNSSIQTFEGNKMKSKKSLENQFSKINSKYSKLTKTSQQQDDDNEVSFLDKSSILMDLDKSEQIISPDESIRFKLKWILLLFIVIGLAIFSSLSTDAFDLTEGHNDKHKRSKKSRKANKQTQIKKSKIKNHEKVKPTKIKQKKQIHA